MLCAQMSPPLQQALVSLGALCVWYDRLVLTAVRWVCQMRICAQYKWHGNGTHTHTHLIRIVDDADATPPHVVLFYLYDVGLIIN